MPITPNQVYRLSMLGHLGEDGRLCEVQIWATNWEDVNDVTLVTVTPEVAVSLLRSLYGEQGDPIDGLISDLGFGYTVEVQSKLESWIPFEFPSLEQFGFEQNAPTDKTGANAI